LDTLDYYNNPEIVSFMKRESAYIKNTEDREDCEQEVFAELYDFMPLNVIGAKRIIKNVCERFKRSCRTIAEHETSLEEAGIA
jgi:hypothetical protein